MVKINWVSLKIWPNTNTSTNSIARIWSEDLKMSEIILSDKTIEYRRQKGPNYRISAKFLNDIMKRSNTTPVKVPRSLVALALTKNLDSVWQGCDNQNNNNLSLIFLPHIYGVMYWKIFEDKFHPLLKILLTIFIIQDK